MWSTVRNPFDSLNTAFPFDSPAASALPQYTRNSCRAFPLIFGTRTQTLASPFAVSQCSI